MNETCSHSNLNCIHLGHSATAHEEATLTPLYEYCQQHPSRRVAYIHTKGSFRDGETQTRWRKNMLSAVVHPDCRRGDACGLQANMYPWVHFPGNFWTAKCSYVSTLHPPAEMDARMRSLRDELFQMESDCLLKHLYRNSHPGFYGIERYSLEAWIGSHPKGLFFDMYDGRDFERRIISDDKLKVAEFPRHDLTWRWFLFDTKTARASLENESIRIRDDRFLAGRLLRWIRLYGTVPPWDSWVWSFFPDGEFWKSMISQHGLDAVHEGTAMRKLDLVVRNSGIGYLCLLEKVLPHPTVFEWVI